MNIQETKKYVKLLVSNNCAFWEDQNTLIGIATEKDGSAPVKVQLGFILNNKDWKRLGNYLSSNPLPSDW